METDTKNKINPASKREKTKKPLSAKGTRASPKNLSRSGKKVQKQPVKKRTTFSRSKQTPQVQAISNLPEISIKDELRRQLQKLIDNGTYLQGLLLERIEFAIDPLEIQRLTSAFNSNANATEKLSRRLSELEADDDKEETSQNSFASLLKKIDGESNTSATSKG